MELANVFIVSTMPNAMIQFTVLSICHGLYSLAINTIIAGFGFVVAIVLNDTQHETAKASKAIGTKAAPIERSP